MKQLYNLENWIILISLCYNDLFWLIQIFKTTVYKKIILMIKVVEVVAV